MSVSKGLAEAVREFIVTKAASDSGPPAETFASEPVWQALTSHGTRLWLDTGSVPDAAELWNGEFDALTTNNTLLNNEVQNGQYDEVVPEAATLLADLGLTADDTRLELAFILNALHGLKLVRRFGAFVSVEEHTDLADDMERAVEYGKRLHEICPQRFIIKLPLTPSGLLATRRLSAAGIAVNHTLGFSARQNYLIARIGRPAFGNVFLGRLNSFVSSNDLGDGVNVGEKAALASQEALCRLRDASEAPTLQIGASLRNGGQIRDLAGLDVLTMPPKAAREYAEMGLAADVLRPRVASELTLGIQDSADARAAGLDSLWEIDDRLVACVDTVNQSSPEELTAPELLEIFREAQCGDILREWSDEQVAVSAAEGKIPSLSNWRSLLASREIGLDALMNLGGLNSFKADQAEMDQHVAAAAAGPGTD